MIIATFVLRGTTYVVTDQGLYRLKDALAADWFNPGSWVWELVVKL